MERWELSWKIRYLMLLTLYDAIIECVRTVAFNLSYEKMEKIHLQNGRESTSEE